MLELYQSFSEKEGPDLKSESSQDELNLHLDKVVYHMFLCQVMKEDWSKAVCLFEDEEILQNCEKFPFGREFRKVAELARNPMENVLVLEPNDNDSIFRKFRRIEANLFNLKIVRLVSM